MALLPVLKGTRSYAARTRILTQSITGFVAIKVTRFALDGRHGVAGKCSSL